MAVEPDSSTAMDADDDNTATDTTAVGDDAAADAVDTGNSNNSNEDSSSENTQPQLLQAVEPYSPQQQQQQQQYLQPLELPLPPAPHTVGSSSDSSVPPIQVQIDVDAQQQQQQQQEEEQSAPLLNLNLNKQYFINGSNNQNNTMFGPQLPPHAVTVGTTGDITATDTNSVNSSVASDSMPGLMSAHDLVPPGYTVPQQQQHPIPLPLPAVNGGSSRGSNSSNSNAVVPTAGLVFPPPEFAKVSFSSEQQHFQMKVLVIIEAFTKSQVLRSTSDDMT
jgi:hypothetical protein